MELAFGGAALVASERGWSRAIVNSREWAADERGLDPAGLRAKGRDFVPYVRRGQPIGAHTLDAGTVAERFSGRVSYCSALHAAQCANPYMTAGIDRIDVDVCDELTMADRTAGC
jgi:hypothetical protein